MGKIPVGDFAIPLTHLSGSGGSGGPGALHFCHKGIQGERAIPMSVQRKSSPSSPPAESDLETTAELPVLDVAAYEASGAEERLGNTDTWLMPAQALRESA